MNAGRTFHVDQYYTTQDYFEKRFDTLSRQFGFRAETAEAYGVWKESLRKELRDISGISTMARSNLGCSLVEEEKMDGYLREKRLLETEPGVIMPFYALVPDGLPKGGKRPAVIAAHGHQIGGKLGTAGRSDIPAVAERIEEFHCDYGAALVKEGFIVFCPDARGFGERREIFMQGDTEELYLRPSCTHLNNVAISLGQSMIGMLVWDLMKLLDYMATRDDCDMENIGCAGLSGGGMQTLWLSALDDRIKCAVISGYFYGYKDAMIKMQGNCSCNFIPHLWEKADTGDIGALIAPRPLLIETGERDIYNGQSGLSNVIPQVNITRGAYALFDMEERLYHHVFDTGHKWNGEKAIPWLRRWLMEGK